MTKTRWKIFIRYDDGWWPVQWAPYFDTKEEADAWIAKDHDWDGWVEAEEEEYEVVCEDCEEDNLDEYACPNNEGYCVDCCQCPEHTEENN